MKRIKFLSMLLAITAMSLTACGNHPDQVVDGGDDDTEDTPKEGGKCGDGKLNKGEECDGSAGLKGITCKSVTKQDVEGTVKCSAQCKYDVSDCKAVPMLASDYEATFHYDLSGVIPNEFNQVQAFLEDPDGYLSEWVKEAAMNWLQENASGFYTAAQVLGLDTMLKEKLESLLQTYVADQETQDKLTPAANAMAALKEAMKDFTVVSGMKVKPSADGSSNSIEESWDSIAFNWTYNCDSTKADCVQKINVKDMGLTNESNLTAKYSMDFYESQDKAAFDGRNFSMEYGVIVMYLYQHKLIPAVTKDANAKDTAALLKWIVNVDKLASTICESDDDTDNDSGNFTIKLSDSVSAKISKANFVTIINSAATYGGNKLDEYLKSVLNLGVVELQTAGTFTTEDSDKNFAMDKLKRPSASEDNITGKIVADTVKGEHIEINLKANGEAVEKK